MEFIIRVALIFFFIQFLVVTIAMVVALLLARPEVPLLGREPAHDVLGRRFELVTRLPSRVFRSVARLVRSDNSLNSVQ